MKLSGDKQIQDLNQLKKEFLNALITGNHTLSSELVQTCLTNQITIKELYEEIIREAMYEIGELWESNKISVATEHMASAIVESILNQLYFKIISKEKKNKTVIAACLENEFHQVGIKMVGDVFEMNGWDALFLGSNTPTSELVSFIKLKKPDLLAISISIYFNLPILEKMIGRMQKEFPELPIVVGGQAFRHGGEEVLTKYKDVVYLPDLDSVQLFIKNFQRNGQKLSYRNSDTNETDE